MENWLRCIRDVARLHASYLNTINDEEERNRRLVELNVIETCVNVYKAGVVQRKRAQTMRETGTAFPRIHALVYDPMTGILKKLPVNFKRAMGGIKHIYDLYDEDVFN